MFEMEQLGDVATVTVAEEMDSRNAQQAMDYFKELVGGGSSHLVVDLTPLNFIDSSGLGALVTALKAARQAGGDIRLCGLSAPVKSIFELTRLYRVFDIFENRTEAVESFD
jgi:anti-sigma B factor antagonist